MFVSKNQIFVFLACVAIGGACGIFFTVSSFFKRFVKNRWLRIVPDVVAFGVFSVLYVTFAYLMKFPSYRIYMSAGAFIGIALYMKSFHIILALWAKKLYTIIVNYVSDKKRKENKKENDGNDQRRKHARKRRFCRRERDRREV